MSAWPREVAGFERFLDGVGLQLVRREESATFGNRIVEYAGARLAARVVSDKGVWIVELADVQGRSGEWYDAAVVRDLVGGRGPDVLPLRDQVEFVQGHWREISSAFGPNRREASHAELIRLQRQRVLRRIPGIRREEGT